LARTGDSALVSKAVHNCRCDHVLLFQCRASCYINTLLTRGLGFSSADQLQFQAAQQVVGLLGGFISLTFIDRIPRNFLFAIGMIACVVALSVEAAITANYIGSTNTNALRAGVAFLDVYIFFFSSLLDALSYFYVSEISPTHLRAKTMTALIATSSLTNILWLQIAPTAFANIGWKFYMVFIAITCVGAVVEFFTFPNTLNMPLEEVAKMFGDADLIAVYQQDVLVDPENHKPIWHGHEEKKDEIAVHTEGA